MGKLQTVNQLFFAVTKFVETSKVEIDVSTKESFKEASTTF